MFELAPYFVIAIIAPLLTHLAHLSSMALGRHAGRWILLNPFDLASVATLVLFAGTRYKTGTDYFHYTSLYTSLFPGDWSYSVERSPQEFGFTLFSLAFRSLGMSAESFILVVSALSVVCAYIAIRDASPSPAFSVSLYILFASYLSPMNTARQGLAVSLIFLAAVLMPRHRILASLLAVLACSMHISAIIAIAVFMLLKFIKIGVHGVMVLVAAVALAPQLLSTSSPSSALIAFLDSLDKRYGEYLTSVAGAGYGTILVSIVHTILAIAFLWASSPKSIGVEKRLSSYSPQSDILVSTVDVRTRIVADEPMVLSQDEPHVPIAGLSGEARWWRNVYTVTGPLALLGITVQYATRLAEYTAILLPLVAAVICARAKRPEIARFAMLGIGVAYYSAYLLNYGGLLPYHTWLFDQW